MMQFLASIAVFCPLVSALAFNAPEVTHVAEILAQGWSPRPTEPPQFNKELLKRQTSSSLSLIEGPDGICGFQFGQSSAPLGLCGTVATCGFATAFGEDGNIVCFDSTTTSQRWPWTSCVGGTVASSCLLDSACSDNPGIVICTGTENACNIGTFIGLGVEVLWCDSTYYTGTIPVSTTYIGEADGRIFTTPGGARSAPPTTTITPIRLTPSSSPIASSKSASIPFIIPSPYSPTPTPTPTPPSKSSTPIGPIIGGVIGGLALIAAIAAGIFICVRYKLRETRTSDEQSNLPPAQPNSQSNSRPQESSEKYPATAQATFIPPAVPVKQEYQNQYQQPSSTQQQYTQPLYQPQDQQPSQPQYNQPQPAAQQSYNNYQAPQQQPPQAASSHTEQQQPTPKQHYSAQTFQAGPEATPLQPKVSQELSIGEHRDSVVSTISSPGSPAPPYTGTMPKVPEMTGESSYHAYPLDDRYEMQS